MISGPLGRRARALPVRIAVPYFVAPLPHGALLRALWSRLYGTTHHLRRHVLLSIGARGSRDPVSAKLEWELVLRPSGRSAVSSRVCTPILVIQVLLWRRLCSLLLARLLGLCWRQLLLRLPLPGAVRYVVHLPFVSLSGRAVAAIHRSLVILEGKQWHPQHEIIYLERSNPDLSGQSCSEPEDAPHGMACKRTRLGSSLAISNVKLDQSFSFTSQDQFLAAGGGSFLVDSTRMPWGQKSAHRKDFPREKTQLYYTFTTNQTVHRYSFPFTSRNFIRPYFSSVSQKTEVSAEASNKMH